MFRLPKHKVFSGALQFTVFVGVVIALLLAGLIMLTYSHSFFILQSKATVENIQLTNTGINYLLENPPNSIDTIAIQELNTENQKVEAQLSQWGIFEKAIIKATNRKKVFYKSALFGTQINSIDRPSLYLQDNFKPLVVVGRTLIKGNVFLPAQGVKTGHIAGEGFYGPSLIDGNTQKSDKKLPELKANYKDNLKNLFNYKEHNEKNYLSANEKNRCTNSFLKPTKLWYSQGEIFLGDNVLVGNIIIKSDKSIRIKKSATLKDIILVAPIIEIEDQVSGNFQLIANKRIAIGKNCKLNYPSAIVMIKDEKNLVPGMKEDQITIDRNSEITGTVCYLNDVKDDNNFKTQLTLNETAMIIGEVYCQGNLELEGKVIGTVYAQQFVVNRLGTIFINHIYNGEINSEGFPEAFGGILLENNKRGIVKWMY